MEYRLVRTLWRQDPDLESGYREVPEWDITVNYGSDLEAVLDILGAPGNWRTWDIQIASLKLTQDNWVVLQVTRPPPPNMGAEYRYNAVSSMTCSTLGGNVRSVAIRPGTDREILIEALATLRPPGCTEFFLSVREGRSVFLDIRLPGYSGYPAIKP